MVPNYPGCSGHLHQSLWDIKGQNVTHDFTNESRLSTIAQQYLAGQLHCLPFIMPMFAPQSMPTSDMFLDHGHPPPLVGV